MFFPPSLVISIKSEVSWKHFLVSLLMQTYCFTFSPSVFPHNFSVFINCRQWVWLEISAELERMINRSVPSLLPCILTVVYVLFEFAFWSADWIAHNVVFTGAFQLLLYSLLDCLFFVSSDFGFVLFLKKKCINSFWKIAFWCSRFLTIPFLFRSLNFNYIVLPKCI